MRSLLPYIETRENKFASVPKPFHSGQSYPRESVALCGQGEMISTRWKFGAAALGAMPAHCVRAVRRFRAAPCRGAGKGVLRLVVERLHPLVEAQGQFASR